MTRPQHSPLGASNGDVEVSHFLGSGTPTEATSTSITDTQVGTSQKLDPKRHTASAVAGPAGRFTCSASPVRTPRRAPKG